MKTNYNTLSTLLIFTILSLSINSRISCQAWYDTDWKYRSIITVSNPIGEPLQDFQIQITLDNSFDFSKTNPDGSDILMTSADGEVILAACAKNEILHIQRMVKQVRILRIFDQMRG